MSAEPRRVIEVKGGPWGRLWQTYGVCHTEDEAKQWLAAKAAVKDPEDRQFRLAK